MKIRDTYSFEDLRNIAEDLVIDEIGRQLTLLNDPKLDNSDAVLDIAALSLNTLKPMYRANLLGRVYADSIKEQHFKEVEEAVRSAIDKIRKNPPL